VLVFVTAVGAVYLYLNSPAFNQRLRTLIVERIEAYTGAKVTLQSMSWSLKQQRVVLEGLTLRGTEPASEPPLARIESISAGVNFRSLLKRHLDLHELHIVSPEIRLNVDPEGRTSLPTPIPPKESPDSEFVISVDSLKVTGGKAIINNQQSNIDFAVTNLKSDLRYGGDTRRLTAQVSYDGTLTQPNQKAVPYSLTSSFDFTSGTVIAHSLKITSGKSTVSLQGRIDKALTPDLSAKLDYSASVDAAFVKRFLPQQAFAGNATARGALEFSSGKFSTTGDLASAQVEFQGWKAGGVKAAYTYQYPMKQLSLKRLSARVLDGTAQGVVVIDQVPGVPRVTANLNYTDVDVAQLARVYPWDPKYVIYSRADGELSGWFEGSLERYEFEGDSTLTSYRLGSPDTSSTNAFPVDGYLAFALKPGQTDIKRSDLRLFNSSVKASGRIVGNAQADLVVDVTSANLADFRPLYPDANGKGSFKGTIKGAIAKPVLDGEVTLDGHKYRDWTVEHAEGGVRLDMGTEMATLRNISAKVGESTATLNGTTSLDGKTLNLRIRSDRIRAQEFESLLKEKVFGVLSGDVTVTSLNPIKVTGRVKGVGLSARGHTFDTIEAEGTYNEPVVYLPKVTISERDTRITARMVEYNRSTGTIRAQADIAALALSRLREFGIPETLDGTIQSANFEVRGPQDRPNIFGEATVVNLSFRGETFPRAVLKFGTNWPNLSVNVSETGNVRLEANINLSAAGYPFEATANFTNYSVERLANFSQGTLAITGNADLRGELTGDAPFSGKGTIRTLDAKIRNVEFHSASPFEFVLEPSRIRLDKEATFAGAYGTKFNIKGSVGLSPAPPLDLEVRGNFDLAQMTTEDWSVTGLVALDGRVNGTASNPAINGTLNIKDGSLGRSGVYTTLSALNGDVRFNDNRVTFDNLKGRVGLGDLQIRGTGLIQNGQIEGLEVRIDTLSDVRLRYEKELRTSVTGTLLLTGTSSAPLIDGDLKLNSLSHRSDFESFLALFRSAGSSAGSLDTGGGILDHLRLSVHVAGGRNIAVKNELAEINSANVNLDILGTWGNPVVTGHIEISDGTIFFQGRKYEITRGNIDFVDRLRIEPVLDIQAETDLRDYRVIMIISGKGDRPLIDFITDPPLPKTEVVSLVGGGKTRDELTAGGTSSSSEELFQGGAKNIIASQLLSQAGSRLGFMGLDWLRVDPQLENASNPSLRLTLTQHVSKDFAVTYSQDVSSTQQRVIMIEYSLSKNLSIVATREETNDSSAFGLDIRLRRRY